MYGRNLLNRVLITAAVFNLTNTPHLRTAREIQDLLGLSKKSIHDALTVLMRAGYIRRESIGVWGGSWSGYGYTTIEPPALTHISALFNLLNTEAQGEGVNTVHKLLNKFTRILGSTDITVSELYADMMEHDETA